MNTFPYAKAIAIMTLDPAATYTAVVDGQEYHGDGEFLMDLLSLDDTITDFYKN